MTTKVSLTYENGVQKGPATDYSMLLEMKRRSLQMADYTKAHGSAGRKGTGLVVDTQHERGFTEGPVNQVYFIRGATLGFLKF